MGAIIGSAILITAPAALWAQPGQASNPSQKALGGGSGQFSQVTSTSALEKYLSTSFLTGLLGLRQTDAVSSTSAVYQLDVLYKRLFALREKRSDFLSALGRYSASLDAGAGRLERDYRLNEVGETATALNEALQSVMTSFRQLDAQMSIDDPEIEKSINTYGVSQTKFLGDVLDQHALAGVGPEKVRQALAQANSNTALFDTSIDRLRMAILARKRPSPGN